MRNLTARIKPIDKIYETMPRIDLMVLQNTVVHTPTQEEYDKLMQLYQTGGWFWNSSTLPTEYYNTANEYTHINVSNSFKEILYDPRFIYDNWESLTLKGFCKIENIDDSKCKKIWKWFNKYKPDRESLGKISGNWRDRD